ncbi:uncharacterized protein LOC119402100 [Rhipicephalus sanguineus]|uniref:uncharacterized protein LOC119402100 n=1 Tax=Rhipicephalus sanguineus TaxID=34632 RepID=UPI0020C42B02|nr:uncharacterized protein LOC119402100 [Rhipicephalus sanguineus]
MAWKTCVYGLYFDLKEEHGDIFLIINPPGESLPFGVEKKYSILYADKSCMILLDEGNATESKKTARIREQSNGTVWNRNDHPICMLWVTDLSTTEERENCKLQFDDYCDRPSYDYDEDNKKVCVNVTEYMGNVSKGCVIEN